MMMIATMSNFCQSYPFCSQKLTVTQILCSLHTEDWELWIIFAMNGYTSFSPDQLKILTLFFFFHQMSENKDTTHECSEIHYNIQFLLFQNKLYYNYGCFALLCNYGKNRESNYRYFPMGKKGNNLLLYILFSVCCCCCSNFVVSVEVNRFLA